MSVKSVNPSTVRHWLGSNGLASLFGLAECVAPLELSAPSLLSGW